MIKPTDEQNKLCLQIVNNIISVKKTSPKYYDVKSLLSDMYASEKDTKESIKTGWTLFDQTTGGFRMREFTIFCGSTGVGKTEFLANISAQLLIRDVPQMIWSVETGAIDYAKRLFGIVAGIDMHSKEKLSYEEILDFEEAYGETMRKRKLYFSPNENRIPSIDLMRDLVFASQFLGCKIAILDNLNYFLEVTTSSEQILQIDKVIHDLIVLCKNIDMHLIMVMHPRKTENGMVNSEFDIKGSSTAVQEAHNVLLFNRSTEDETPSFGNSKHYRTLKFQKMRRRGMHSGRSVLFYRDGVKYKEGNIPINERRSF